MSKTLYRKLVDSHTVVQLDDENVLLYADLHLMNEYTSPQAFAGLHERGLATLTRARTWPWSATSSRPSRTSCA